MGEKQLLFSVTANEFDWEYFCTGGPGGQNQNRKKNGVRCRHKASGAMADAREMKSQLDNKERAFKRCVQSKRFQDWLKLEASRRLGQPTLEQLAKEQVNILINDPSFKFKVELTKGKWQWMTVEEYLLLPTEVTESANISY